jgi:hypothetical protein
LLPFAIYLSLEISRKSRCHFARIGYPPRPVSALGACKEFATMEKNKTSAPHLRTLFVPTVAGMIMLLALGAMGMALHAISATARAETAPPLAQIAQLLRSKGYDNVFFGQLCEQFRLAGRLGDRNCRGYQLTAEEGDRKSSFDTYIESGTQAVRIILVNQDTRNGHAFLTSADGELQQAALGNKKDGLWRWSATSITPELRTMFSNEVALWVESLKDIEALPDR